MTRDVTTCWRCRTSLRSVLAGLAVAVCIAAPLPAEASDVSGTVCAVPPFEAEPAVAAFLSEMSPILTAFPTLADTLDRAGAVCLSDHIHGAQGYVEPESRRIVMAADLPDGLKQAVFVHELRHWQQQEIGACPSPDLSMAENARAVFAMEADASVASLVVAWARRDAGAPEMWRALADWPMQGDIARAFSDAMAKSGDLADAAHAAFDQWYANEERRRAYYIAACSDYLDRADRTKRLPSYGALDPAFFDRLCRTPDGLPYPCAEPD